MQLYNIEKIVLVTGELETELSLPDISMILAPARLPGHYGASLGVRLGKLLVDLNNGEKRCYMITSEGLADYDNQQWWKSSKEWKSAVTELFQKISDTSPTGLYGQL